jgi:hypothetical protein
LLTVEEFRELLDSRTDREKYCPNYEDWHNFRLTFIKAVSDKIENCLKNEKD